MGSQGRVSVGHEDLLWLRWMPSDSSTPTQEVLPQKITQIVSSHSANVSDQYN